MIHSENFNIIDKELHLVSEQSNEVATHKLENVTLGNTPHGIAYERGVFTPTIEGAIVKGINVYSSQKGYYTRINDVVYVEFEIELSQLNVNSDMSGAISISGLPFAVTNPYLPSVNVSFIRGATPPSNFAGWLFQLAISSSVRWCYLNNVSGADATIGLDNLTNNLRVRGNGTYNIS